MALGASGTRRDEKGRADEMNRITKLPDTEITRQAQDTSRHVGTVLALPGGAYRCTVCESRHILKGFDQHDLADLEAWLAQHRRCGR